MTQDFTHIVHIADVHIRLLQRHREYKAVFRKLYKEVRKQPKNTTLIVIAGDIVHSKLEMSPELIDLTVDFLDKLAKIHPVLVIPGNHDANLSNLSRLDSLTPIIKTLKRDNPDSNLEYFRNSGTMTIRNIEFAHMSVFDEKTPEKFPTHADLIGNSEHSIALFHGVVNNATTDTGYVVDHRAITTELFEPFDITLLGDIHKRQFLNKRKTILYPGSLIQQNFGESVEAHGFAVWTLADKSVEFVDLPNDYGYYTVKVDNGTILPSICDAKHPRVRIVSTNTSDADLRKIVPLVKKEYGVKDIALRKIGDSVNDNDLEHRGLNIGSVRDIEYQNSLIAKHLVDSYQVEDEVLQEVFSLNRDINSELPELSHVRNVTWKPKRLEFSGMFSYGEDNVVDFTDMQGLYGLFADNAAGKTSILEALMYCCFDKCSKTSKASAVLNSRSDEFRCKFIFELDGVDYYIERHGSIQRYGNVKVNVDFYTMDSRGKKISLNGTERSDTNRSIRSYIGTYEEMILTSFSLQTQNAGFIDAPQRSRKEFLSKFLDLEIFEQLNILAKLKYSEVQVLLREYKKNTKDLDIVKVTADLEESNAANSRIAKEKADLVKELKRKTKVKDKLLSTYRTLNESYRKLKLPVIEQTLEELSDDYISKNMEIKSILRDTEGFDVKSNNSRTVSLQKELEEYENTLESARKVVLDLNHLQNRLDKQKTKKEHIDSKTKDILSIVVNAECEVCVENNLENTERLENLFEELSIVEHNIEQTHKLISNLPTIKGNEEEVKSKINSSREEINLLMRELSNYKNSLLVAGRKQAEVESISSKIDVQKGLKVSYEENKVNIEHNRKVHDKIDIVEAEIDLLEADINKLDKSLTASLAQNIKIQNQLTEYSARLEKLNNLEHENTALKYYIEATKRDSVPYRIISHVLPELENEVNNILAHIVDFSISMETDGKNINAKLYYDDTSQWPIELTSGMERFISQLAIRNALINVSNLPKPNFIVIDEGWGSLSAENLINMGPLMELLKMNFDFSIIISHVDAMRDMVDHHITISKERGFSKVKYA